MSNNERAKSLENVYFNGEHMAFRLHAMRNKLIGLWAAALLKKEDANEYASELAAYVVSHSDEYAIIQKLKADFAQAGVTVADDEIHTHMSDAFNSAAQILREGMEQADKKAVA